MSHRMNRRHFLAVGSGTVGVLAISAYPSRAWAEPPTADELKARAVAFLRPRQKADGSWSSDKGPGVTALVVTALLRSKKATPSEPIVAKGLAYLEGFISPKGDVDYYVLRTEQPVLAKFHLSGVERPRGEERRNPRNVSTRREPPEPASTCGGTDDQGYDRQLREHEPRSTKECQRQV